MPHTNAMIKLIPSINSIVTLKACQILEPTFQPLWYLEFSTLDTLWGNRADGLWVRKEVLWVVLLLDLYQLADVVTIV